MYLWKMTLIFFQFSSVAQLCLTLCDPMDCSTSGFPVHHQLPDLVQIHVHWVGDVIQPFYPQSPPFSLCLQSFPASGSFPMSQSFQWVNSLHQVAKVLQFQFQHWIFQLNIQDWFPLRLSGLISLQLEGLKSLLQHHSSKASILWSSAFFMVQFSPPYMTTGKTIALTWWTLSAK